jgi:SAM-dependent methyltransferase
MRSPTHPRECGDARGFFRSRTEDYDRAHYGPGRRSFMSVRLERMLEAIDALSLPPGARVFEGGCGPGHLCAALVARGLGVWTVDTSRPMLERARRRGSRARAGGHLHVSLGSLERCPFADESFDLVCSAGVIEYLAGDGPALAELRRVLRPEGHLLLTVTNRWSPMLAGDLAVEFLKRRRRLVALFNAGWTRLGRAAVRPRPFAVRRHRPARVRSQLAEAGFEIVDSLFFHFVPWPHPLPLLAPALSDPLGERMERWGRSPLGLLADGYLVVARKRAESRGR